MYTRSGRHGHPLRIRRGRVRARSFLLKGFFSVQSRESPDINVKFAFRLSAPSRALSIPRCCPPFVTEGEALSPSRIPPDATVSFHRCLFSRSLDSSSSGQAFSDLSSRAPRSTHLSIRLASKFRLLSISLESIHFHCSAAASSPRRSLFRVVFLPSRPFLNTLLIPFYFSLSLSRPCEATNEVQEEK